MARLLSSMQKTDHDDEMRIQSGYVPLWDGAIPGLASAA